MTLSSVSCILLLVVVSPYRCQESLASNLISGYIACPNVCQDASLIQHCDSYLTSPDLCPQARQCCLSAATAQTAHPPASEQAGDPAAPAGHKCTGECTFGFFAMLCDNVDADAECPDNGYCCVNELENILESSTTTLRTTPIPLEHVTDSLPRCHGYCLHNVFAVYCEHPAVLLSNTKCEHNGDICCDTTRLPTSTAPLPEDCKPETSSGSCTVSLLASICSNNDKTTDIIKCVASKLDEVMRKVRIRIEAISDDPYSLTTTTTAPDTSYTTAATFTTPAQLSNDIL